MASRCRDRTLISGRTVVVVLIPASGFRNAFFNQVQNTRVHLCTIVVKARLSLLGWVSILCAAVDLKISTVLTITLEISITVGIDGMGTDRGFPERSLPWLSQL